MTAPRDTIEGRIQYLLERLGLHKRVECHVAILALLDQKTPHPFRDLAEKGLTFAAGATNRQILDYIAGRLRKSRLDRELRDSIMLPLRAVGIAAKAYADKATGKVIPHYWKTNTSSRNMYMLTPEFKALIDKDGDPFVDAASAWEIETPERRRRLVSAEAAASAIDRGERLVTVTRNVYCPHYLPEYQVVFVDDGDGTRINPEWQGAADRLQLPLDLTSRWPDIILNIPDTNRCWIVDCVETDGEVDVVRRQEMIEAFEARGLTIEGFTTVYRTAKRFAQRQHAMDNIAAETCVWIAELGGSQWHKKPLKE